VTGLQPGFSQERGEAFRLAVKLLVAPTSHLARLAFPDERGLFCLSVEMAIEAVVRSIDLATDKPFGQRGIPFENLVPLLEPVKVARGFRPIRFRVLLRLLTDACFVLLR